MPSPVFTTAEEVELNMFLMDCWVLGIPRMEQRFGMDIQFMVNITRRNTPFNNGLPG